MSNRLDAWLDEMIADPEVAAAGASKIALNLKSKLEAALDPKAEKRKVSGDYVDQCSSANCGEKIVASAGEIPRPYLPRDANVPLMSIYHC